MLCFLSFFVRGSEGGGDVSSIFLAMVSPLACIFSIFFTFFLFFFLLFFFFLLLLS